MSTKLYAAYGSNISSLQMSYRCPRARFYAVGTVRTHALQFRGQPDNAYATVVKAEGARVPVVVWCIEDSDETSLDTYERYPVLYQKEQVTVALADGRTVEAMAYVMDPSKSYGMPALLYYRTILEGYREFGLPEACLSEALGVSAQGYYAHAIEELNAQIQRRFPEPP